MSSVPTSSVAEWVHREALEGLEDQVRQALETGDEGALEVLGYGEISTVIAWRGPERSFACKRLPPFPSRDAFAVYDAHFTTYLRLLEEVGVGCVESSLQPLELDDGTLAVWCVQPLLPAGDFVPAALRAVVEASSGEDLDARVDAILDPITERLLAGVSSRLGVDGQASNWAWVDGAPRYLDVTTPLMRDEHGSEVLDIKLFIASLPWALRGMVRRFMLGAILDKYYDPRGVLLDLAGNLLKERLEALVPRFLERCNRRLERPIFESEVKSYYRGDARMWALLQRMRRSDRWWQRKIRHRVYPFLLPGRTERYV